MAKRTSTGLFNLRIIVLARTLATQAANAEQAESWPEPALGTNEYFAARETLSGSEQILQGIRQSTGSMKLRIKGRAIPIAAYDRIKVKTTGELFNVTGMIRESADTVITIDRVYQQTTRQ